MDKAPVTYFQFTWIRHQFHYNQQFTSARYKFIITNSSSGYRLMIIYNSYGLDTSSLFYNMDKVLFHNTTNNSHWEGTCPLLPIVHMGKVPAHYN